MMAYGVHELESAGIIPNYGRLWDINPDVRILGSDWEKKSFTGIDLTIPIYFHERNHPWSTSYLRKRVYEAELSKKK